MIRAEDLVRFLIRVKCWMPQQNVGIRNEIDALIAQIKHQIRH